MDEKLFEELKESYPQTYAEIRMMRHLSYEAGLKRALELIGEDEQRFISRPSHGMISAEDMEVRNALRAELRTRIQAELEGDNNV